MWNVLQVLGGVLQGVSEPHEHAALVCAALECVSVMANGALTGAAAAHPATPHNQVSSS
jgi:hypothetical protein